MSESRLDLLIVGSGPAGLLSAIMAAQLGLRFEMIEKRESLHAEPSAHVIKTHSMEVYRRVGVSDAIFQESTPEKLQSCVVWCESLSGLCYGKLDLTGKKGAVPRFTNISPAYSANVPQNVLEPILHQRLIELVGKDPVQFGADLTDFSQDNDGIVATIRHGSDIFERRAHYILGADGAGSQVRRSAGIEMQGPRKLAQFLAIHINSNAMPFLERHPGVVFFIRSPRYDGFFIMHQPVGSQVFMLRVDTDQTPLESFDEQTCRSIMDEILGKPHEYGISSIGNWVMSAQVAETYRNGRALIIGDAGHRFPPTGGLGLNTGVEDVENLLWKLAAVIRGKASPTLLDTYEQECRPIAVRNTEQSVKNNHRMRIVDAVLHVDDGVAALENVIAELKQNKNHPRFDKLKQAIDDQIDHFAFLELDMAARITQGSFIPSARRIETPVPVKEGYQPSFTPGCYIPHFWVAEGVSSLDLARFDCFTLLVPADHEKDWHGASSMEGPFLPIAVLPINASMRSGEASVGDFWGEEPFAILLRPDGRIAWVEPPGLADRLAQLRLAIEAISKGQSSRAQVSEVA